MSLLTPHLRPALRQALAPFTPARYESTTRRMTKKLRLPPAASFRLDASSPAGTHIIYNPPPTAASVKQTPALFMAANDPRRALSLNTPSLPLAEGQELPPPVRKPYEKKYHLKPEDFAKIRELRKADPVTNTRKALAEQFGCSPFFIGMVAEATKEHKIEMHFKQKKMMKRWGRIRTKARAEKAKRKAGWGGADGL
ncbi:hypothetical protein BJ508DRAFT_418166 [Ascobolus immersus RN42]|uniref:Mitochondrial ribosomal protein subunit L20 n=1 Tax=Ascobolus immersus RN42 TaxID=1160509 RepID=A0A3N4HU84_ASCIM|nr:hypothetical protein BJ508DRAFT_418166 [Ascobolus immersus RN42]